MTTDETLTKAEAAAELGCDVRTLERNTAHLTEADGRLQIGGMIRPARIEYTRALIDRLKKAAKPA